jgi:uncharacterized phage infection (PIP) family protein YhgE
MKDPITNHISHSTGQPQEGTQPQNDTGRAIRDMPTSKLSMNETLRDKAEKLHIKTTRLKKKLDNFQNFAALLESANNNDKDAVKQYKDAVKQYKDAVNQHKDTIKQYKDTYTASKEFIEFIDKNPIEIITIQEGQTQ